MASLVSNLNNAANLPSEHKSPDLLTRLREPTREPEPANSKIKSARDACPLQDPILPYVNRPLKAWGPLSSS